MACLMFNGLKVNNNSNTLSEEKLNNILNNFLTSFQDLEINLTSSSFSLNETVDKYYYSLSLDGLKAQNMPIWGVISSSTSNGNLETETEIADAKKILDVYVSDNNVVIEASDNLTGNITVVIKNVIGNGSSLINSILENSVVYKNSTNIENDTDALGLPFYNRDGDMIHPYTDIDHVFGDENITLRDLINKMSSGVALKIIDNLTTEDSSNPLSANQGVVLYKKIQELIDSNFLTSSDVINNLLSTSTDYPLSAYQGKLLNSTKLTGKIKSMNVTRVDENTDESVADDATIFEFVFTITGSLISFKSFIPLAIVIESVDGNIYLNSFYYNNRPSLVALKGSSSEIKFIVRIEEAYLSFADLFSSDMTSHTLYYLDLS